MADEYIRKADAIKQCGFGTTSLHIADNLRKMLPADVVQVVRCKDCKYSHMTYDGKCKYCDIWFPDEKEYMDGDYYCASAEQR